MKAAIYQPKGRAKEYADLAVNLYSGCPHGCIYCFSPKVLHKDRESFHGTVEPRKGIIEAISADCAKLGERSRQGETIPPIHLCFTCDPYPMTGQQGTLTTRLALEVIKAHGLNFSILTKNGLAARRDFTLYEDGDSIGASLTCGSLNYRYWEPNAGSHALRIHTLWFAHNAGIKTWASLEPVIYPDITLEIIKRTAAYVDHYKIGKLNYHEHAKTIDWADFTKRAVDLLESLGKSYYIKDSLKPYLGESNV